MTTTPDEQPQVKKMSTERWVALIERLGIPGAFMFFICLGLYQWVPPVVDGHVKLLERTGDTLETMEKTLEQTNLLMKEVVETERKTEIFMAEVHAEHLSAQNALDTALEDHTKIMESLRESHRNGDGGN